MVDVSGSMSGTPMNAAIGLGLLFMALRTKRNSNADKSLITFSSNPTFIDLNECQTFASMVKLTSQAEWGMSTDFVKAFDMLMQRNGRNIKNASKRVICMSDMQINQAIGHTYTDYSGKVSQQKTLSGVDTMYDTICTKWKAWYGLPDNTTDLPTIVFWNLRSDVTGSPVDSSVRGVIQISGYSASLVKMILFGEELTLENERAEKPTPSQVLYKKLAAKEYDSIREALGWNNGVLSPNSVFAKECINLLSDHNTHQFVSESESDSDSDSDPTHHDASYHDASYKYKAPCNIFNVLQQYCDSESDIENYNNFTRPDTHTYSESPTSSESSSESSTSSDSATMDNYISMSGPYRARQYNESLLDSESLSNSDILPKEEVVSETQLVSAEPELVSDEPELVSAEPQVASVEPELVSAEPPVVVSTEGQNNGVISYLKNLWR